MSRPKASQLFISSLIFACASLRSRAVFTGTPVYLRWAHVEQTAALFANNTPNTQIFYNPIKKAAEEAIRVRISFVCVCSPHKWSAGRTISRLVAFQRQ
jgi:hypothetical protein